MSSYNNRTRKFSILTTTSASTVSGQIIAKVLLCCDSHQFQLLKTCRLITNKLSTRLSRVNEQLLLWSKGSDATYCISFIGNELCRRWLVKNRLSRSYMQVSNTFEHNNHLMQFAICSLLLPLLWEWNNSRCCRISAQINDRFKGGKMLEWRIQDCQDKVRHQHIV